MVCEMYLSKTIKMVLIFKDTTALLNNISNTEANDKKKKETRYLGYPQDMQQKEKENNLAVTGLYQLR